MLNGDVENNSGDKLLSAIRAALSETDDANRQKQAEEYLNSIRDSPKGWQYCVEIFKKTNEPKALFWCLHVFETVIIKRWDELNSNDIKSMAALLMGFIREVCSVQNIPDYIRSKIAQVLVHIAKKQYPEYWPTFFSDLIKILQDKQTPGTAQMFFGILKELNWSIVENHDKESKDEMARNIIIKDTMRTNDLGRIVEVWYTFLSMYNKTPLLTKMCLETMGGYISWIGIELIANEKFLTLLYQHLKDEKVQSPAADCLCEIINKRMDCDKKFQMIKGIGILRIAAQTEAYNATGLFPMRVGALIASIGRQLAACVARGRVMDAVAMTLNCYEIALRYFAHPDYKVSATVVDFCIDFWNMINQRNESNEKQKLHNGNNQEGRHSVLSNTDKVLFQRTLEIVSKKLRYPEPYDVNEPDDEEKKFDEYRGELDKVILALTRVASDDMVLLMINHYKELCDKLTNQNHNDVTNTEKDGNIVHWTVIESDLHIIYRLVEDYHYKSKKPIEDWLVENSPLCTFFKMTIDAKIARTNAPRVITTYFDFVVRYWAYLKVYPNHIGEVLHTFVDQRGLKSTNSVVRSRATVCLCRLIKNLCMTPKMVKTMVQFSPQLINALSRCIHVFLEQRKHSPFGVDEINNVCETISILVRINDTQVAETQMRDMAGLFLSKLKSCIEGKNEWEHTDPVLAGRMMSEYINCLSSLFKSCTPTMTHVLSIVTTSTQMVLRAYSCLPTDELLRKQSICFFHQSQLLLKEDIIPLLKKFFQIFIKSSNESNVVSTLQIFSQIISSVGNHKDVINILDEILIPLLDVINQSILVRFENIKAGEVGQSQDFQLKIDILRHYYMLIGRIIEGQCHVILISSRNSNAFQRIIGQLLRDCIPSRNTDVTLNKQCFAVFKELIIKFGKSHEQLENLLLTQLVKSTFDFVLSPEYNPKKPDWDRALGKVLLVHKTLFDTFGTSKASNAIGKYLVSVLNVPTQAAEQFCHSISNFPQNERQLKQFMLEVRSKCGSK